MLKIVFFIFMLGLQSTYASEDFLSEKVLKEAQSIADAELGDKKVGNEKLYYINLIIARELKTYEKLKWSRVYYQKAVDTAFEGDKSEALFGLAQLSYQENQKEFLKKDVENLEKYFSKNPNYKKTKHESVIKVLKYLGLGDKSAKPEETPIIKNEILKFSILEEKRKDLIESKKYGEAFKLIDRPDIKSLNVGYKIEHDLLNVLIHKKKMKFSSLLCKEGLEKFPKDWSYTVLICRSLKEYLLSEKISNKSISDLERYFKKRAKNRKYLLTALKDLQ